MRATALLLATLVLGGCASTTLDNRYEEHTSTSVPAGSATVLRVENTAGRVRIEPWNRGEVHVDIVKRASSADALAQTTVTVTAKGGAVAVVAAHADMTANTNVDLRIQAPASLAVRVHNMAGTTRITGFSGDVTAESRAGTIDVELTTLRGTQRIDLSSTAGTIDLTVPKHADATIQAHATIGSFHSNLPTVASTRTGVVGASGSGTIGSGSARVSLQTTTGSIDLLAH